MEKAIKYPILFIFLTLIFNFLEYGLKFQAAEHIVYPTFLAAITLTCFIKEKFRKILLGISLISFGLMMMVYMLSEINLAYTIGSFAFTMLCIVFISYAGPLFKKGYIEKL